MKKFNVGIIGYGHWGKILYRYFSQDPGFAVTHIATRHPENIRGDFGDATKLTSPYPLILDDLVDVVVVATPIGTHYEYIMEALKAGRHVFSEKPLTARASWAQQVRDEGTRRDRVVFTDYILTFSPAVAKMVSLAREGAIGTITGCSFHVRQLGHFSHSVYWDLGSHILSILDMIHPVDQLTIQRQDHHTRDGVIESGLLSFTLPGGGFSGFAGLSFNHPVKSRNLTLYGTLGTLYYDMMAQPPLTLCRYRVDRSTGRDPLDRQEIRLDFDEFNTVREVVGGFYRVLTGQRPNNLDMAVRVSEVLEKLEKFHRTAVH